MQCRNSYGHGHGLGNGLAQKETLSCLPRKASQRTVAMEALVVQTDANANLRTPEKFNKDAKKKAERENMRLAREALAGTQAALDNARTVKLQ